MKNLTTISLFVFWAVTVAILTSGLVFYQDRQIMLGQNQSQAGANLASSTLSGGGSSNGSTVVLNMQEISKHNTVGDCWMLIEGKVYNITSYFGSHPGGSSAMAPSCGKDATAAYSTKDPYATSAQGAAHSSRAVGLLASYYIGDLNQITGQQKMEQIIKQTNTVVPPAGAAGDNEYDD